MIIPKQNTAAAAGHRSPNPAIVATVYTALFAASLIVTAVLTGGGHFPSPYESPEVIRAFFMEHASALRIGAMLLFGSAIPLGIFTATVVSRLQYLGMNVAGVTIALYGGIAASIFVAISGLAQWVLSQPGVIESESAMRALQLLVFATGGAGHVVTLGLLLAGICIPAMFGRLLPKWLVWMGLILAGFAVLSTFSLLVPQAAWLLPLARIPAFIWMILVGLKLPRSREEARRRRGRNGTESGPREESDT